MLCVRDVTKRYGDHVALDAISFEVGRGEVTGFLGPNGAGKTTAMRIISGYMPATSGRVTVAGHDVFSDALAARRLIGYMPEHVPLYEDLRAGEYLQFRARLKGVRRRERRREVERVARLCFVDDVLRKPIATLSRGYRQRVGLADALLGSPPLLILDEPTAGLDPNQVREVRQMVRDLGREHTVLLSTHILSEVEAVCSRALIINEGRLVCEETVRSRGGDDAAASGGPLRVELVAPGADVDRVLGSLPGTRAFVRRDLGGGAHSVRVEPEPGRDLREALGGAALEHGWVIRELRTEHRSLEELFVHYTAGGEADGAALVDTLIDTGPTPGVGAS
jgi:ABC-2 type transport system ATP-binding protein